VHDELDLLSGQSDFKRDDSAAGPDGLKEIQVHLHSVDFWRVRLGVDHPA